MTQDWNSSSNLKIDLVGITRGTQQGVLTLLLCYLYK